MAALLLLTLLSLSTTLILSLAENIHINCGASQSYVDSNKVTWVGDKDFVTTGKSMNIPFNITPSLNTIRSFDSGKTSCYTNIPVKRGRKILVRTSFLGEKSVQFSFNIVYDGIHSQSVKTALRLEGSGLPSQVSLKLSEVIFSPASENISVCLKPTIPTEKTYISTIEVYGLDAGMYGELGPDEGLILRQRFAYGAKSYEDSYGRIWFPLTSKKNEMMTSDLAIDITGVLNKPPKSVMSQALSVDSLQLSSLPLTSIPVYLALYFSELQNLDQTQRRSFNVSLENTQLGSGPIVPVFGKATQVVIRDIVANSSSQVIFESTTDTNLRPIINAMELYSISTGQDVGGKVGGGQSGGSNDDASQDSGKSERAKAQKEAAEEAAKSAKTLTQAKPKLKLIIGVSSASAAVTLTSVAAVFYKMSKSKTDNPQSNTGPAASKGSGEEAGTSPLVGKQLKSDVSHPGHDGQIGVNDSDVVQKDDHHKHGAA